MTEREPILVPAGTGVIELEIKRSRFIACAEPVSSAEEARNIVSRKRTEHPGASHVVHAFTVGDAASETSGMSDDGEPKGTAGRPVMEVLKGRKIRNVIVTVVRYFGGTKLGTGGLVKAYGDAAKGALDRLPVTEYRLRVGFALTVPYELYDGAKRMLAELGGTSSGETFTDTVMLEGTLPADAVQEAQLKIGDLSAGKIRLEVRDPA